MKRLLIALLVAAVAGAVAAQPAPRPAATAERGLAIASVRCSACHALDSVTPSPNPGAPSFPEVGLRWPGRTLAYRIGFVTGNGHYAMPARPLTAAERGAVAAYIREIADRVERDRGN